MWPYVSMQRCCDTSPVASSRNTWSSGICSGPSHHHYPERTATLPPSLQPHQAITVVSEMVPYMWVILCPRRKHHTNVGGRLAPPARARKCSDVTRGHRWASEMAFISYLLWNNLSSDISKCDQLVSLKNRPKTYLYKGLHPSFLTLSNCFKISPQHQLPPSMDWEGVNWWSADCSPSISWWYMYTSSYSYSSDDMLLT